MSSWAATVMAYSSVAAIALVVQVLAVRRPSQLSTIGQVLAWAMRRRSTQLGVLVIWWWLGWHFVTAR
jgi:hypothetical protein